MIRAIITVISGSVRFVIKRHYALCVLSTITYFSYKNRRHIIGLLGTAPYPSVTTNGLKRALQNGLISLTRYNYEINWYPLEGLQLAPRQRHNNNGHAKSGALRDTARQILFAAVHNIGLGVVELSPAPCTLDKNADSFISYYAPGDLAGTPNIPRINDGHAIVCIDTDYYLKHPDYILGYGVPCILYSFNPLHVAGVDGECRFRINDNRVVYEVDGGGRWEHPVWDWMSPGEFIRSEYKPRTLFEWLGWCLWGIVGIRTTIISKVYHARPWDAGPHRSIIWTTPVSRYKEFMWITSDINARELRPLVYSEDGEWNRIVFKSPATEDLHVSIGRVNDDLHIELPKSHLDLVMGCMTPQSVTSRLIGLKYTDPCILSLVGQYYNKTPKKSGDIPLYIPSPCEPPVHWVPESHYDQPEVKARIYSAPLISQAALAPQIRRWETLAHSLEKRLTMQLNDKKPHMKYYAYAREFVELLVPTPHVGAPYGLEETILEMNKPAQRQQVQQILDSLDMTPRAMVDAFTKNEACMKTPRVISACQDMRYMLQGSRFEYAFKDAVLKDRENVTWFMPGLTPVEIVDSVREFAATNDEIASTDYDGFDASINKHLTRMFYHAAQLRFFAPEYHQELKMVQNQLLYATGRAKAFGFRYSPGVGVIHSGFFDTSNRGSTINGGMEYCALRMEYPYLKPKEAFRLIGPKSGDDGLTQARIASRLSRVANDVGIKLKVEKHDPEQGLTFLARVYPDVHNTTTTFQDPLRTVRKLHMTFRNSTVPLADAAIDRLTGYLITDRYTPVISDYCQAVINYYEKTASSLEQRVKRHCRISERGYWADPENTWPQNPQDYGMMMACISARMGLDVAVLERFICEMKSPSFNPWHFRRLHPDLECVYDETLDDDCQPTPKWMDARETTTQRQQIQDAINTRADIARTTDGVCQPDQPCGSMQGLPSTPSVSREGHGGLLQLPQRDGTTPGKSDPEPGFKTNRAQGPRGRGTRGRTGPPRGGGPTKRKIGSADDIREHRSYAGGANRRKR